MVLFCCVCRLLPTLAHTRNSILERGENFSADWVRMLSRILNGCLMWFWTSAKKASFSFRPEWKRRRRKQLVHEPSRLGNEQKSEQELNEFSIMHLSGAIYKGEKHTKEHESRRATAIEEEAIEKSVKEQQPNIIITHITSRSEKSHSFSTRNAL